MTGVQTCALPISPLVDVKSAGISSVVDNQRILELPLQGRQVTDLLVLSGAAVQTATVTSRGFPGGVNISVAGGLPTGVGYTLDGATHNNPQQNANLPLPFPDALQEFRVATSGLSAQNGVHSGAAVNAITKSGTNTPTGSVSGYFRDSKWGAKDFIRKQILPYSDQQVVGTFGGPIQKDKMHIFGHWEFEREPRTVAFTTPWPAFNQNLLDTRTEHKSGARFDSSLGGQRRGELGCGGARRTGDLGGAGRGLGAGQLAAVAEDASHHLVRGDARRDGEELAEVDRLAHVRIHPLRR